MYLPMSFWIHLQRTTGVITILGLPLFLLCNFVYDSLHKQTHSKRWFKQTLVCVEQLNRFDLFGRTMLTHSSHLCTHMSSVYNLCPHNSLGPDLQPESP